MGYNVQPTPFLGLCSDLSFLTALICFLSVALMDMGSGLVWMRVDVYEGSLKWKIIIPLDENAEKVFCYYT